MCSNVRPRGRDGRVFLEGILEIQLCGNTAVVKYRLMACESCILIMLIFLSFFQALKHSMLQLCKLTFECPLKAVLYLLPPSHCDSYYCFLINNTSLTTSCLMLLRSTALQNLSFGYQIFTRVCTCILSKSSKQLNKSKYFKIFMETSPHHPNSAF